MERAIELIKVDRFHLGNILLKHRNLVVRNPWDGFRTLPAEQGVAAWKKPPFDFRLDYHSDTCPPGVCNNCAAPFRGGNHASVQHGLLVESEASVMLREARLRSRQIQQISAVGCSFRTEFHEFGYKQMSDAGLQKVHSFRRGRQVAERDPDVVPTNGEKAHGDEASVIRLKYRGALKSNP